MLSWTVLSSTALSTPRRNALAVLAVGAALATTAAEAPPSPSPSPSPSTAPGQLGAEGTSQPLILEGPGGRRRLSAWTLRKDPADRGTTLGWQRGGFAGSAVSVPNVVSATPYKGRAGVPVYEGSVAWYRTDFQALAAGLYALSFQSASFQANVWVDGHSVGSHKGSYLPFETRARLMAGTHTVVVRVDWRNPGQQSREGFHRTWFNWGGLGGEVDVRRIGDSELSNPTVQTILTPDAPDAAQASVRISVDVHNYGPSRTIVAEGALVHGMQSIPVSFPGIALAHGQTAMATASVTVPAPALWSPASPNLYQLTLAASGSASASASGNASGSGSGSGSEGSYLARVGLRQLSWQAGRVYVNGRQLKLHGATIQQDAVGHGDALTPADEDTIVSELKAIGANAARAQHPLDPALLERLDAAGILVWQGVGPVEGAGAWYSTTPRLLAAAERQARSAALAAELHPSIFAWNVVNEVAGNGRDGAEVRYVRDTARWLHAHDPTRMVAVDVWGRHPPQRAGALYSEADAVAETDYTGWYDNPHDDEARARTQMRARLATMERTFVGKVLVISEFGAESNTLNPPGSAGSYAYQSRLLSAHIAVYAADRQLSGMLIWLLRDYPVNPTFEGGLIHGALPHLRLIEGLNQKGLFTYGGQAKPAVAVVARLFGELGPA